MFLDRFTRGLEESPAYEAFWITDVNPLSGVVKRRRLARPANRSMRVLHDRLRDWLRGLLLDRPHATGVLPGSSTRGHLRPHAGNRHMVVMDLHSAFPSVDGKRLAEVLCEVAGIADGLVEVCTFLEMYCLDPEHGGLLQGLPANQDLFEVYAVVLLDQALSRWCQQWRVPITYTRYCDDLLFSCSEPIGRRRRRALRALIAEAGFTLSHRKCRVFDLSRGPVMVNGYVWTIAGNIYPPGFFLRRVLRLLKNAVTGMASDAEVAGVMGQFMQMTRGRKPTRKEQTIFAMYRWYRRWRYGRT